MAFPSPLGQGQGMPPSPMGMSMFPPPPGTPGMMPSPGMGMQLQHMGGMQGGPPGQALSPGHPMASPQHLQLARLQGGGPFPGAQAMSPMVSPMGGSPMDMQQLQAMQQMQQMQQMQGQGQHPGAHPSQFGSPHTGMMNQSHFMPQGAMQQMPQGGMGMQQMPQGGNSGAYVLGMPTPTPPNMAGRMRGQTSGSAMEQQRRRGNFEMEQEVTVKTKLRGKGTFSGNMSGNMQDIQDMQHSMAPGMQGYGNAGQRQFNPYQSQGGMSDQGSMYGDDGEGDLHGGAGGFSSPYGGGAGQSFMSPMHRGQAATSY